MSEMKSNSPRVERELSQPYTYLIKLREDPRRSGSSHFFIYKEIKEGQHKRVVESEIDARISQKISASRYAGVRS